MELVRYAPLSLPLSVEMCNFSGIVLLHAVFSLIYVYIYIYIFFFLLQRICV
jgi:hypothetical protein